MKKLLTTLLFFSFVWNAEAQVPKKVIVEHFTNTLCSVCASRNPGFYSNLNNQNGRWRHLPLPTTILVIQIPTGSRYASTLIGYTCGLQPHLILN